MHPPPPPPPPPPVAPAGGTRVQLVFGDGTSATLEVPERDAKRLDYLTRNLLGADEPR